MSSVVTNSFDPTKTTANKRLFKIQDVTDDIANGPVRSV